MHLMAVGGLLILLSAAAAVDRQYDSDPPATQVNECLLCVDACWNLPEGSECIRPFTGEMGICEAQDRCTDKLETSFKECMRCVKLINGQVPEERDEPEGCRQNAIYSRSFMILVLLIGLYLALRKPQGWLK